MSASDEFIWVVTADTLSTQVETSPNRGIREITSEVIREGIKIPAENLKSNVESFFKTVLSLVSQVPQGDFPYVLDEIEICAEVSGEGKIQLVGGITAGAKGGITFKLKRVASGG
jgi:hypothetical protein